MLLANQRLQDGNQILARIMSLLKSILGKRVQMALPKKNFYMCCFSDEILLAGVAVPLTATNNKEFTGKSSLTLFCAESSEKKIRLKYHITN